ncbi:MAG TPA: hypothetical protein VHK91_01160 [Flavisolibacter sp.]|jgi:hypothetical protein|nr:hypothetical protein [Flavisolibacter sp.]
MLLPIHDNLLISDLQERFSKCFPCLKLEFYKVAHHPGKASEDAKLISPEKKIGAIRKKRKEGTFRILSSMTVREVEQQLEHYYGLHAQVFRNENGGWIQTTGTNSYTLQQQVNMCAHARISIDPKYSDQLEEYGEL